MCQAQKTMYGLGALFRGSSDVDQNMCSGDEAGGL
jgi:hypothetical protein